MSVVLRLATLFGFALTLSAASALIESRAEGRFSVPERGEAMLIDFRPDSIRNWKISQARLYLFLTSGKAPEKLPLSTVTVNWTEENPTEAAKGAFGKLGSTEEHCPVKQLPQGWIEVQLPPTFLEALAAGKSFGLAWLTGPSRINGRSPVFRQPYILAEGAPAK